MSRKTARQESIANEREASFTYVFLGKDGMPHHLCRDLNFTEVHRLPSALIAELTDMMRRPTVHRGAEKVAVWSGRPSRGDVARGRINPICFVRSDGWAGVPTYNWPSQREESRAP